MLIGHDTQRAAFLAALASARMHHAWLLTGARGIGKRCFAQWAALKLLANERGEADVSPEHPAARLLAAGSHPDFRLLAPPVEGKGSASGTIIVEQIRASRDFLHSHPSLAKWRVMIVDSIDDMNLNAANAFLKELEEPRAHTLYLLISHAPARLLPTIRSRCRRLPFDQLPLAATQQVLGLAFPDLPALELESLARVANGAPGTVFDLGQADMADLERWIEKLLQGIDAVDFARTFAAQTALPRFRALLLLTARRLALMAQNQPAPALFDLYDEAEALLRDAIRLAYDRVQVAMAVADLLGRAGRIETGKP